MTPQGRNPSPDQGATAQVGDELRQDAEHLKDSVGARARQEAESRKSQAVHVAGSASTALNTAADDLRDNPDVPDWMASALQQAARKIEGLASHVDGRGVDELGRDVNAFARRNPGTFLAASAAAGFAAARVLRAGADRKRHDHRDAPGGHSDAMRQDFAGTDTVGGQKWPADENIMPTESGGYAPAFGTTDDGAGGTTR